MQKHQLPSIHLMYKALVNKDSSFEGIFFVGVKTTGIFCRPTCTARKPKIENVEFFATSKEALSFGYRPCKICHPISFYGETPDWLRPLLKEINDNPSLKYTDNDLRNKKLEPARVRRWFKKYHGITFQGYLRSLRINRAFGQIKHNDRIIDSAFDSGFESLSGFTDAFKKKTAMSPSASRKGMIISVTRILTPLGPMFAGATEDGLCLLEFTDRRMLETQMNRLRKLLHAQIIPGENKHFVILNKQLDEYFAGKRKQFDIPLVFPGTDFQISVWQTLQKIPYGKTWSYEKQAMIMGKPKTIRAVARANGDNRISIIIPCHRVIGKNDLLTGYGGGLLRKKYLLELEGNNRI
jgi:AraC family transcriptional regulator of adaptative response/methylated-DNA-[protein]-cysteine methyltransferase